ncbi:MAG TPA: ankyrin repeat domain-containing protein [Planctomycetota bacterium]|nr:ankyrin repeat domain-containing protein [Planctomycetota bacterium]
MKSRRLTIPVSVVLFLAFTLVGTYLVRQRILERHMLAAMEMGDEEALRLLLDAWPCPVNARRTGEITPLHWAAAKGDKAMVALLIAKGADVNATDDRLMTPLHWAAFRCCSTRHQMDIIEALLTAGANPNIRDKDGKTLLHPAAALPFPNLMRLLLERGADPDVASRVGETPLHRAVRFGGPEAVALLLSAGAQVNPRDNQGRTPLGAARAAKSDPGKVAPLPPMTVDEIIQLLREHGAKE